MPVFHERERERGREREREREGGRERECLKIKRYIQRPNIFGTDLVLRFTQVCTLMNISGE